MTSTTVFFKSAEEFAKFLLQVVADHRVERAHRFIEEQDIGVEHEGAHEADALPLAAGKLRGKSPQRVAGELRAFEQIIYAVGDSPAIPAEVPGHERDVGFARQMRKEPALLDDISDAAAQLGDVVWRDRISGESDLTGGGGDQSDHQAEDRRFAAAAGAQSTRYGCRGR